MNEKDKKAPEKKQKEHFSISAVIAIVAFGILVSLASNSELLRSLPLWQKGEGWQIDQRYWWRGEIPTDTNIVLVGLQTTSMTLSQLSPEEIAASPTLQLMKQPYPWDRRVFANTVEKLIGAGAKVVVLDFIFSNPGSKEGDDAFAKVIEKYQNQLVLGAMIEPNERTIIGPHEGLLPEGRHNLLGYVNLTPDVDGVTRRGHYLTSLYREDRDPKVAKLVQRFPESYPDDLIHMSALAVKKFAGSVDTPPYYRDNFIDFQGLQGSYPPIPLETLFVDRLFTNPPISGATQFLNKIVIVGPIANIFHDVHVTPFREIPGPEIQAQMMSTLLNGSSLLDPSVRYDRILTYVMVIIAAATCLLVTSAALKPILMGVTLAGFVVACQYAFVKGGTVLHMMPPLFGFISTSVFGVAFQFFQEQIERRRTRNVLVRCVSKNVANLILEDRDAFEKAMRGQKKMVTILFSDIRGFTSLTEVGNAEQLVNQLNEYFQEMVALVDKVEGTLQKFIGDAIMAAWGDTYNLEPEESARRAVETALHMREGLAKMNSVWKDRSDRTQLQIGIGVNYGEAVVGYVGSKGRNEFTAMGDVVNLTARLETATKQFYTDILIGETVEELTRKHFVFRKVGLLTVKGKAKPVEAYAVLSDKSKPPPDWLKLYHEGVEMFRRREFAKAIETFKIVLAQTGGQDFLCEMYIEWSTRYHRSPPPLTWAGNFVLKEK